MTPKMATDKVDTPAVKCTPLPWRTYDRGIGWEVTADEHDNAVNDGLRETFSEADAKLIVIAVNNHESLVDIARTIVTVCDEGSQSMRELACCEGSPLVEACREVLKKLGRKAIEPAEEKPCPTK